MSYNSSFDNPSLLSMWMESWLPLPPPLIHLIVDYLGPNPIYYTPTGSGQFYIRELLQTSSLELDSVVNSLEDLQHTYDKTNIDRFYAHIDADVLSSTSFTDIPGIPDDDEDKPSVPLRSDNPPIDVVLPYHHPRLAIPTVVQESEDALSALSGVPYAHDTETPAPQVPSVVDTASVFAPIPLFGPPSSSVGALAALHDGSLLAALGEGNLVWWPRFDWPEHTPAVRVVSADRYHCDSDDDDQYELYLDSLSRVGGEDEDMGDEEEGGGRRSRRRRQRKRPAPQLLSCYDPESYNYNIYLDLSRSHNVNRHSLCNQPRGNQATVGQMAAGAVELHDALCAHGHTGYTAIAALPPMDPHRSAHQHHAALYLHRRGEETATKWAVDAAQRMGGAQTYVPLVVADGALGVSAGSASDSHGPAVAPSAETSAAPAATAATPATTAPATGARGVRSSAPVYVRDKQTGRMRPSPQFLMGLLAGPIRALTAAQLCKFRAANATPLPGVALAGPDGEPTRAAPLAPATSVPTTVTSTFAGSHCYDFPRATHAARPEPYHALDVPAPTHAGCGQCREDARVTHTWAQQRPPPATAVSMADPQDPFPLAVPSLFTRINPLSASLAVVGCKHGHVSLWDPVAQRRIQLGDHGGHAVTCVAPLSWSGGAHVASGCLLGLVKLWNVEFERPVRVYREHSRRERSVRTLTYVPSVVEEESWHHAVGQWYHDNNVARWTAADGCDRGREVFRCRYGADNELHPPIYTCAAPRSGEDPADMIPRHDLVVPVSRPPLAPGVLVSGGWDGAMNVYDLRCPSHVCEVNAHRAGINASAFVSGLVVTGGWDRLIKTWDLRYLQSPVHQIAGHKRHVTVLQALPGGELLSCSADRTMRVWDLDRMPVNWLYAESAGLSAAAEARADASWASEWAAAWLEERRQCAEVQRERAAMGDHDDDADEDVAKARPVDAVRVRVDDLTRPTLLPAIAPLPPVRANTAVTADLAGRRVAAGTDMAALYTHRGPAGTNDAAALLGPHPLACRVTWPPLTAHLHEKPAAEVAFPQRAAAVVEAAGTPLPEPPTYPSVPTPTRPLFLNSVPALAYDADVERLMAFRERHQRAYEPSMALTEDISTDAGRARLEAVLADHLAPLSTAQQYSALLARVRACAVQPVGLARERSMWEEDCGGACVSEWDVLEPVSCAAVLPSGTLVTASREIVQRVAVKTHRGGIQCWRPYVEPTDAIMDDLRNPIKRE